MSELGQRTQIYIFYILVSSVVKILQIQNKEYSLDGLVKTSDSKATYTKSERPLMVLLALGLVEVGDILH